MPNALARQLYSSGRSHALASIHLFEYSFLYAEKEGIEDKERFSFNGTFSLSVHYLLGLGFELMLKAALAEIGQIKNDKPLRDIGHDLIEALEAAEAVGFASNAPNLRALLEVLNEPFKRHWLRYGRPDEFQLPGDFDQANETLRVLDEEIAVYFADH